MNQQQRKKAKIRRRATRKEATTAKLPTQPNQLSLENLSSRLEVLENAFSVNLRTLFGNHTQLKQGLDAAELNQRAMAKVIQDMCATDVIVKMANGVLDWSAYYKDAEADIERDKFETYKARVRDLNAKADYIEQNFSMWEAFLAKELEAAHITNKDHPQAQTVARFLGDVRAEITKVRTAADIITRNATETEKVEEFKVKLLSDAVFLIGRALAKNAADDTGAKVTAPEEVETITTEFGG